jgi:hypothetical protein
LATLSPHTLRCEIRSPYVTGLSSGPVETAAEEVGGCVAPALEAVRAAEWLGELAVDRVLE